MAATAGRTARDGAGLLNSGVDRFKFPATPIARRAPRAAESTMDQITDILHQDLDPTETQEWVESLNAVINHDGTERAHYLLERMVDSTRRAGGYLPFDPTTEYVNTIPPHMEARSPGNAAIDWRIRSLIRWNALATVVRANRKPGDLGGHISSFASSATLYDVGFNHFWRAPS